MDASPKEYPRPRLVTCCSVWSPFSFSMSFMPQLVEVGFKKMPKVFYLRPFAMEPLVLNPAGVVNNGVLVYWRRTAGQQKLYAGPVASTHAGREVSPMDRKVAPWVAVPVVNPSGLPNGRSWRDTNGWEQYAALYKQ